MTPCRIQRRRVKGWKMPENTVYVGRPTILANHHPWQFIGRRRAVALYREGLEEWLAHPVAGLKLKAELAAIRGKNLACWCNLCEAHKDGKPLGTECPGCDPCHADVLLEMANREVKE